MSLVLWSPSMEMRFSVRPAAQASAVRSSSRPTLTSVQRKQSMVARRGSIMPAPLATPTSRPAPTARLRSFGKRSVVMIARATGANEPSRAPRTSPGSAASISATGRRQPMIPVEAGRNASAGEPVSRPSAASSRSASAPVGVQTFAILLLTSTPRMPLRPRRSRPIATGAPGNLFAVYTAANSWRLHGRAGSAQGSWRAVAPRPARRAGR